MEKFRIIKNTETGSYYMVFADQVERGSLKRTFDCYGQHNTVSGWATFINYWDGQKRNSLILRVEKNAYLEDSKFELLDKKDPIAKEILGDYLHAEVADASRNILESEGFTFYLTTEDTWAYAVVIEK